MRHFFIVSREHSWLHAHLRERFQDDPDVGVILDRRVAERRRTAADATPGDRRKRERRRPLSQDEDLRERSHYIVEV
jgi:hypothetical protein